MNLKTTIVLSVEKDGKIFTFSMDAGSSFGAAYDAAYQILHDISDMGKEAITRAKTTAPAGDTQAQ